MQFQRHTEQCLEDLNKIESIWILLAHIFFIRFTQNISLLSITAVSNEDSTHLEVYEVQSGYKGKH